MKEVSKLIEAMNAVEVCSLARTLEKGLDCERMEVELGVNDPHAWGRIYDNEIVLRFLYARLLNIRQDI